MTYPGGKGGAGVYQAIINQMPPHDVYIEPFAGNASILKMKRPAPLANIALDADGSVASALDLWASRDAAQFTVVHGDALAWLAARKHWSGRELVYADPPYLMATLAGGRQHYREKMWEFEHAALLTLLAGLPCMVMLSGYDSALYRRFLADWRVVTFTAQTRRGPATEYLWCNFPEPSALHDHRFVGADFRERERIGRKAKRWARMVADMPLYEAQAVLSAALAADGERRRQASPAAALSPAASPRTATGSAQ